MAIAFDAVSQPADPAPASGVTFAHTCTGTDRALLVGCLTNDLTDTVSGVTYNGTAMTEVAVGSTSQAGGGGRTEKVYLFYLANPASGTNNVVVTCTGTVSNGLQCYGQSYTGVHQTTPVDISAKNSATGVTSITATATTTVDNCWAVSRTRDDTGSITDSTNYAARTADGSNEMGDSAGGVGAAGSKSATAGGASGIMHIVTAFIAPATGTSGVVTSSQKHTLLTLGVG